MGAPPQQNMFSSPAFELFRRGLNVQTIQQFHGINVYSTIAQLGPDWAQDLLNVVISGSGGLSKLRLPVPLSVAVDGQSEGPFSFWDFQQGNGTRQVIAHFGQSLYYYSNDLSSVALISTTLANQGVWSFVSANNILFGANGQLAFKWTGSLWQAWGLFGYTIPPSVAVITGTLSPAFGYIYAVSPMNSRTGHVGNASPYSATTGPLSNKAFHLTPALTNLDPQIDTLVFFRSLDGGGTPFRLAQLKLSNNSLTTFGVGAKITVDGAGGIIDQSPDTALDQTASAPLINNPPLLGKYLAVGQGRIFIFNLSFDGAPQDVIYSGYEQIFIGRPEESFPPNNRLRLSIGAEQIAGGGVLQSGVVAFSQTGRMYMLRGAVEDITLSAPVNFSSYLEELPWTLGCASHFTIQATPYGLVWLAGDKTVQLFDGASEPIDISTPIYPLLQQITPGYESQCVSGYFNWLERDIYTLLCPVNGSTSNNRLFFFAFNKIPGTNQVQDIEVFVSDVPGVVLGASPLWVGLITTSKLQRMLCVSGGGFIQQIPVSSDTVGGITQDYTINPQQPTKNLNAYWRGGYFGSESPYRSKMFRWLRLITDQGGFKTTLRYIDEETSTLKNPEIVGPDALDSSRQGMNRKAKRASIEINFPQQDVSANVLELSVASIPTADR